MKLIQKFRARRYLRKEIGEDLLAFVMSESIYEQQNLRGDPPIVSGGECGRCHRKNGALRMDVVAAQLIHHHVILKGYPPSSLCPSCLDEWLRTCGFVCPRCHRAMKKSFVGWAVKEMTLASSLKAQAAVLPSKFEHAQNVMSILRDYLSSYGREELAQENSRLEILCPNCVYDLLCKVNDGLVDKFQQLGYTPLEMEEIPSHFEEFVCGALDVIDFPLKFFKVAWGLEDDVARQKKWEAFLTKHEAKIRRVWNWLSEKSGYGKSC